MPRVALTLQSRVDGPWVYVKRLTEVRIEGSSRRDVIHLEFRGLDAKEPLDLMGREATKLNYPEGHVRIKRVEGDTPITAIGICDRR